MRAGHNIALQIQQGFSTTELSSYVLVSHGQGCGWEHNSDDPVWRMVKSPSLRINHVNSEGAGYTRGFA